MAKGKTLELSIKIAGKMDKSFSAALKNSHREISSFSKSISGIGTVGIATMGALAAGTVATIASCTQEAAKFENYMSDVIKVVDGMADSNGKVTDQLAGNGKTFAQNYAVMEETLKDLSTQIPYTFEDLTRLAAAAGQSGKTFEDLTQTDFIKDIAMWGTAMDISADQAGEWGAKWEEAFSMTHNQVMEVADVINYLGNNYATTAGEIANSVNDAASLGQLAGVDVKATAAIATSMQAMGVSADKVGTSIKRIYTNITLGDSATAAQEKALAKLGFTATGIAEAMQVDGAGTLLKVFRAVNDLPEAEKLSTLNALFGQWAIEGGAKVTQNLDLLEGMLAEVSDKNIWSGSMEKEFIVSATKPEAIATMLGSAKSNLMDDIGSAFLPAYQQFGTAMIDFIQRIRDNMPELEQLAGSLGELASQGVEQLGKAMDTALPYIQKGLDYLINNGDEVARIIGGLATAFVGMKFAPAAEGLINIVGDALLGAPTESQTNGGGRKGGLLKSVATSGQTAWNNARTVFGYGRDAAEMAKSAGLGQTAQISNGIAGAFAAAQNLDGLNSRSVSRQDKAITRMNSFVSRVRNNGVIGTAIETARNSSAGQYFGRVKNSMSAVRSTTVGSKIVNGVKSKAGNLKEFVAASPPVTRLTEVATKAKAKGSGLLGSAGLFLSNTAMPAIQKTPVAQGVGKVAAGAGGLFGKLKGVGAAASSFGGAGLGAISTVLGPLASGFGSLFLGAAPIIGVISTIIAVVSILGDNLEGIRSIVGNVFGEKGLAVFDTFTGKLGQIGQFIQGLFEDGGVAKALSGFRDMLFGDGGIFAGNELAAGAFDGVVTVLQSIMGVVGQVVEFATGTVKPIILDIFKFITETVLPNGLKMFQAVAPHISGVISDVGGAIMLVMEYIGQAIQFVMPYIQGIIEFIMNIGIAVVPVLAGAFSGLTGMLTPIIETIKEIFDGLIRYIGGIIDFVVGVFTGDWEKAWQGVKDIFGGIWESLTGLVKLPINGIIGIINAAIGGLNAVRFTMPEWSPIMPGEVIGFNIPEMPYLAKGGFTNGVSIAGEAGTEAVISFQRSVRRKNIDTWTQAGRMLGVNPVELSEIPAPPPSQEGSFGGGMTFAPQIIIQGNADRSVIDQALAEARAQFEAWYLQMQRKNSRTAY